ncbi:MAG: hypothetical protein KFH87_14365 [Bacteroidetes bacterium]|nr:hypothetical protein [Bacteroidota bacterium]
MSTTIQFLREPKYEESVILFILTPAGLSYDPADIGKNLFGSETWSQESLLIDSLAPKPGFRYSDISFHWSDFLDLAFRHVDHALFFVPHKHTFKEIVKESLLHQNPDLYSFSFRKFTCEHRKHAVTSDGQEQTNAASGKHDPVPHAASGNTEELTSDRKNTVPEDAAATLPGNGEKKGASSAAENLREARKVLHALLDTGWSGNAVSKHTGITAMTISGIKNGKSSQISSRVYSAIMNMKKDSDAGRITPAQQTTTSTPTLQVKGSKAQSGHVPRQADSAKETTAVPSKKSQRQTATQETGELLESRYIAVDAEKLEALIDHLKDLFTEGLHGLQEIKRQLSHRSP